MDVAISRCIDRFAGQRILVLGDVMLDEYVWGRVRRISPEAPVPVVDVASESCVPGGAGNSAANVASLGGVPVLASVVGNDEGADRLALALGRLGVAPGGLMRDAARRTTRKTRIVAHEQQVVRVDSEDRSPLSPAVQEQLLRYIEEHIENVAACIVSDYSKGVVSQQLMERLVAAAGRAGKPVVVDPKPEDFHKYRGATVVKPNLLEAERVCNCSIENEDALLAAGNRLVELLAGSAVMITRGAEGIALFRPDQPPVHVPALPRRVYDVTGAGDTVGGTLAMALAAGATLEQAAHLSNRTAGIVIGKVGTNTVSLEELRADLAEHPGHELSHLGPQRAKKSA